MQTLKSKDLPTNKVCQKCGEVKSIDNFSIRKKSPDGFRQWCKECDNAAQKIQYANNKKYYLDRNRIRRAAMSKWIREYKEGKPCFMCGGIFPYYVMDFNHIKLSTKKFNLGHGAKQSLNAVKAEIAKCELLCANCHRVHTYATVKRDKPKSITKCIK